MKTIKQVADELKVSKQAVRQKIDKLKLTSKLQITGNQFLIDDDIEQQIIKAFNKPRPKTSYRKQDGNLPVSNKQLLDMLAAKDQQIKQQADHIQELTRLVDQAQHLQGIAEQKLKALEDKEAAAGSEEKTNKSLWKRIFHKEK